mgnify:CR=1 FL=1
MGLDVLGKKEISRSGSGSESESYGTHNGTPGGSPRKNKSRTTSTNSNNSNNNNPSGADSRKGSLTISQLKRLPSDSSLLKRAMSVRTPESVADSARSEDDLTGTRRSSGSNRPGSGKNRPGSGRNRPGSGRSRPGSGRSRPGSGKISRGNSLKRLNSFKGSMNSIGNNDSDSSSSDEETRSPIGRLSRQASVSGSHKLSHEMSPNAQMFGKRGLSRQLSLSNMLIATTTAKRSIEAAEARSRAQSPNKLTSGSGPGSGTHTPGLAKWDEIGINLEVEVESRSGPTPVPTSTHKSNSKSKHKDVTTKHKYQETDFTIETNTTTNNTDTTPNNTNMGQDMSLSPLAPLPLLSPDGFDINHEASKSLYGRPKNAKHGSTENTSMLTHAQNSISNYKSINNTIHLHTTPSKDLGKSISLPTVGNMGSMPIKTHSNANGDSGGHLMYLRSATQADRIAHSKGLTTEHDLMPTSYIHIARNYAIEHAKLKKSHQTLAYKMVRVELSVYRCLCACFGVRRCICRCIYVYIYVNGCIYRCMFTHCVYMRVVECVWYSFCVCIAV